jgi:flagellar biosynthesis/type III secretory pathway chaperone
MTALQPFTVSLTELLAEEQVALKRLLAVLQLEQIALTNCQLEEVTALALEKAAVIGSTAEIVARRTERLRAAGFGADRTSMERLFSAHSEAARSCRPIWMDIRNAWQRASAENKLNDTLVRMHLVRAERALSVLRQAAANPSTYGPDGRVQNPSSTRTPLRVG